MVIIPTGHNQYVKRKADLGGVKGCPRVVTVGFENLKHFHCKQQNLIMSINLIRIPVWNEHPLISPVGNMPKK